jgi:hypothetical protein
MQHPLCINTRDAVGIFPRVEDRLIPSVPSFRTSALRKSMLLIGLPDVQHITVPPRSSPQLH